MVKPLEEMYNATALSRIQNITVKYAEFLYVTYTRVLVKSYNLLSFMRRILTFKPLMKKCYLESMSRGISYTK